jgi:hypothetical protein
MEGGPHEVKNRSPEDLLWKVHGFVPDGMRQMLLAVKDHLPLLEAADLAHVCIHGCVQELCHYRRDIRRQILEAALARATTMATKAKQLEALLEDVGREINVDFLDKATRKARTETNVDILRKDPALKDLLKAYDLADDIWNAY